MSKQQTKGSNPIGRKRSTYGNSANRTGTSSSTPVGWNTEGWIDDAYRARKEEEEWESEARRYGVGY